MYVLYGTFNYTVKLTKSVCRYKQKRIQFRIIRENNNIYRLFKIRQTAEWWRYWLRGKTETESTYILLITKAGEKTKYNTTEDWYHDAIFLNVYNILCFSKQQSNLYHFEAYVLLSVNIVFRLNSGKWWTCKLNKWSR